MTYYVSFNTEELDLLEGGATLREIALYLILKRRVNFKSGVFGAFGKQHENYESLARLLSRPPSQGRAAETFSGSNVSRLLDGLERMGLVADRDAGPKRLTLRLPLSPIKKVAMLKAPADKASGERLLDGEADGIAEGQAAQGFASDEPTQSILTSFNTYSVSINTEGAGAPAPGADGTPHPTIEQTPPSRGAAGTFGSVAEIEERMIRVRGLQFATGKISRTFYERWQKHGIQREQIEEAISQIEDDFLIEPTPKAIDDMLRSWKKGTGRGRVAL
jgi:hypothetical protein